MEVQLRFMEMEFLPQIKVLGLLATLPQRLLVTVVLLQESAQEQLRLHTQIMVGFQQRNLSLSGVFRHFGVTSGFMVIAKVQALQPYPIHPIHLTQRIQ